MNRSETQRHQAPRYPDSRNIKDNPEKVISDLLLILKQLWSEKIILEMRVNLLEEKIEQIGGIRPPLRYPL